MPRLRYRPLGWVSCLFEGRRRGRNPLLCIFCAKIASDGARTCVCLGSSSLTDLGTPFFAVKHRTWRVEETQSFLATPHESSEYELQPLALRHSVRPFRRLSTLKPTAWQSSGLKSRASWDGFLLPGLSRASVGWTLGCGAFGLCFEKGTLSKPRRPAYTTVMVSLGARWVFREPPGFPCGTHI